MNSLSTAMRLRCLLIPRATCAHDHLGPVDHVDQIRIPPAMHLGARLASAMMTLAMLTLCH